ncbi:MAG: chemotaxis response regulator protein-glutamate methylesterase [Acidobacteria bacterium]|nr:chemotaxis response regulator protein-glutamate methylesterase [Acidobacteriota bacterium]
MSKIRVLVVDDSPFNRKIISEILESSPNIEVVGKAFDGEDALRKIVQLNPDVLTLDLEMPRMDGFAVLRWLMANRPMPVLVVSSRESNRSVFKALDLGAVDFVVKPSRTASPRLRAIEEELVTKVLSIPHLRFEKIQERVNQAPLLPAPAPLPTAKGEHNAEVIAIAASTGGPPAVQQVLSGIPKEVLSPILVCQHMPPIFTRLFADRLSTLIGRVAKEAVDGDVLFPGEVYVAPGGCQMGIRSDENGRRLVIAERKPQDRFAPSANYLFGSVARVCGSHCLAVVLTGMGDDGLEGVKEIKAAGGKAIAESQKTAVIYGMPRVIAEAGLADHVVPLDEIPPLIGRYGLLAAP